MRIQNSIEVIAGKAPRFELNEPVFSPFPHEIQEIAITGLIMRLTVIGIRSIQLGFALLTTSHKVIRYKLLSRIYQKKCRHLHNLHIAFRGAQIHYIMILHKQLMDTVFINP